MFYVCCVMQKHCDYLNMSNYSMKKLSATAIINRSFTISSTCWMQFISFNECF